MVNKDSNGDYIGVIRSAIVFGKNEKHYDIVFYNDRIEIIYLGEYKYSRSKQMFSRDVDAFIYRILKNKKRRENISNKTVINVKELSSIRLRNISFGSTKEKTSYVLLEISTSKGKYEFYINAKIVKVARSIINKFYKSLRKK